MRRTNALALTVLLLILSASFINAATNDDFAPNLLSNSAENHSTNDSQKPAADLQMILRMDWHSVQTPFTIAIWLLLASVAKILFHVNKKFGDAVPDSALLIVVGVALGFILKQFNVDEHVFTLEAHTFFLYLLPPIIFDAGYFMPNRQLFENFDSVVLFAVVGTIFNALAIGFTLYAFNAFPLFRSDFSLVEVLLFSALISAVDPVAVIAVFEEVHVNAFLFVNVFGEALFNDGVAVVLYTMFKNIVNKSDSLQPVEYFYCLLSFFVIAFGGILIGLFYAALVSLATKYSGRVKIVAPVFIFIVPYLAYLSAETFGMSSILAITTCGITMKQYVKGNITADASSSVKYFVKTLAQCSETVLFMFLGLSTVSTTYEWDFGFIGVTIALCLIYRCIGVVVQCNVLNRFRKKKFALVDQFILAYGGLRGAIAFGLAISMPEGVGAKKTFITACIAVIFFTVFIQGITIRPLVYWLKVERLDKERRDKMIEKVYSRYCDFTMAGIEDIAGFKGPNAIREVFERFNAKVLKPLLMRHERQKHFDASDILRAYKKIALQEAAQIVSRLDRTKKNKLIGESPNQTIRELHSRSFTLPGDVARSRIFPKNHAATVLALEPPRPSITQQYYLEQNQRLHQQQQKQNQAIDTDALYHLFSELLDSKIADLSVMLRRSSAQSDASDSFSQPTHSYRGRPREHDIKDNYMEIMGSGGTDVDSDSLLLSAATSATSNATSKTSSPCSNPTPASNNRKAPAPAAGRFVVNTAEQPSAVTADKKSAVKPPL